MECRKSKKSRIHKKKRDRPKQPLSPDKASVGTNARNQPTRDQNSKTVKETGDRSVFGDRDTSTAETEKSLSEGDSLLECEEQSTRAVKDSSHPETSIGEETVGGIIAPSNSPLPPAEQSNSNHFKVVHRKINSKQKEKSEAPSTDSLTDKSGTSGVMSYSTSLEDIALDKNLNLVESELNESHSSCAKHAFHKQQPTAPPALAGKPALCDACSQTMLSYISVVQEFLEGLALDISHKVDPSSPCLQCVKERLMPPRQEQHSVTCKHLPASRTVDTAVEEQSRIASVPSEEQSRIASVPSEEQSRIASVPSEEQKYAEMISRPSHLNINGFGDSIPTSEPPRLDDDLVFSEDLRGGEKAPVSSQTEEMSRLPTLVKEDIQEQKTDGRSHPARTEYVSEADSTSKQLDFLYKFKDGEYTKTPQTENDNIEQRKEQTVDPTVQHSRTAQYGREIPQISSHRETYSHRPSALQPKQGLFAPLPDRWPVPQPSSEAPSEIPKATSAGKQDFAPTSPLLSREVLQTDSTTISGQEREVYDSARGLAGWESLSDLQGIPEPVGPRITSEAYVTMASSNAEALGCLVLGASLLLCGTSRTLTVLITDGISASFRPLLSAIFHVVQPIRSLDSLGTTKLALLDQPELGVSFGKLHVWRLAQFSKCVYLNPDTLVVRNCDELFCHEELSAVPDIGWPDCFNSGVFVFSPSVHTFWQLVEFAENRGSYDGGDQGLLNTFFNTWSQDIHKKLSFIYNLMANVSYTYTPAFKQFGGNVKIIQFQGSFKPWHVQFHSESGQIAPSSNVHPTFIDFVKVWINVFRARIIAVFPSDIQSFASSNTCYSASEILRFFPSPVDPDVEFLLTPPSVRSYPSPTLHLGSWVRSVESQDYSHEEGDDDSSQQPCVEGDSKGYAPGEAIASDEAEESSVFEDSPVEALEEEGADKTATEAPGDEISAKDDSSLAADGEETKTVAESTEDESESNPIPGSEVGDYQGMMAWEQGRMDYLGHDSSENILRRLHFLIDTPNRLV